MRIAPVLLLLAGCSPPTEPPVDRGCYFMTNLELRALKHLGDARSFERLGSLDEAEAEYWAAELEWFGIEGGQEEAAKARKERLAFQERRRADASWRELWRSNITVRIPQEQIEITKHVRDGERAAGQGRDEEADREFASAERKIFALPEAKAMAELLPLVRESRLKLRDRR